MSEPTEACASCGDAPCRSVTSRIPDGQRCVLVHRQDPCRPRRTTPGLLVCIGHREGLLRTLRHLAALDRILAARAAGGSGQRAGARSAQTRLPADPHAAEMRRHIRSKLAGWVRILAVDRRLLLPWQSLAWAVGEEREQLARHRVLLAADPDPADEQAVQVQAAALRASSRTLARLAERISHLEHADETTEIVAWLVRHHDHLLADPEAADGYATDLRELTAAAWPVAYPEGTARVPVGRCPGALWCDVATRAEHPCPGMVIGTMRRGDDLLPEELACDTCGAATPPHGWITLGRKLAAAGRDPVWLSAADLAELWDIPLKTVHRWSRWHRWPRDNRRPARYDAEKAQATYDHYRGEQAAEWTGVSRRSCVDAGQGREP